MVAPIWKKGDKLELGGRDSNEKDHAKKGGWGGAGEGQRLPPQYVPCSSYAQSVVVPGLLFKKNSASNIVCVVGSGAW